VCPHRYQHQRVGPVLVLAVLTVFSVTASGEDKKPPRSYTVSGERHGVSFFPAVDYPETKPVSAGQMDFRHYHKLAEVMEFLNAWAKDYPNLVDLYPVGKSYEGRDIWQLTITNKATGKDTEKPAVFLEGNRHSGEVTAAESALYFAWYVLTHYGRDPEITRIVDTSALYVKVKNNPDGSELYLNTAQSNRSSVRPHDDDQDGLLDEDPAEDLDGDGFCFRMRRKVEEGKGEFIIHPDDKTGRLMKRVGPGKGNYEVYSEGLDNDGDGKYNEDGIGGLDLHRNYPENWRPEPGQDLTGRGETQPGAGAYPLSEPETRAVVVFLLQHPNVSIGQSMDTSVPMLLRPPSTSRSEESMLPGDLALYRYFDEQGKKITGYPYAGDVFWDYANLPDEHGEDESQKEKKGEPLFGHSPDFGYFAFGAIWYGDELWSGGKVIDYDRDGKISELEVLRWDDEALGGRGFKNWTRFAHPQLGEVEIGGFNPKFFSQNPPVEFLEEWVRKEVLFNLFLAKSLPRVKVVSAGVRPLGKEPGLFEVKAVFANEGFLPTALDMARRVKIVKPDRAEIGFPEKEAEIVEGPKSVELGWLRSGEKKEVTWKVKALTPARTELEIAVLSTRGGVDRKKLVLGPRS
jgi:Zinc carboxypeptidase